MQCDKCDGGGRTSLNTECARCLGTGVPRFGVSYAGIGSRETPETILKDMELIAMRLAIKGWVLRSGGARGADRAFHNGCKAMMGAASIRIATLQPNALAHASMFHPAWDRCNETAKGLHARNSLVMCGDWFDDPVKFVACWTPEGAVTGGTGQALRIAAAMGIPVYNLALAAHTKALLDWIAAG